MESNNLDWAVEFEKNLESHYILLYAEIGTMPFFFLLGMGIDLPFIGVLLFGFFILAPTVIILINEQLKIDGYKRNLQENAIFSMIDDLSEVESTDEDTIDYLKILISHRFHQKSHYQVQYDRKEIIRICLVCELPIYEGEQALECPKCHRLTHKSHLLEWLRIKGNCPNCGLHLQNQDFLKYSTILPQKKWWGRWK